MSRIPATWSTAQDVANRLGISTRHLRTLRQEWIARGICLEGKHYWQFSPRNLRFDMDAMTKLAHSQGRIIKHSEPS